MPINTPSSPSCIPLNLIKSYLVSMKIPINIPWNRIDFPMQPYQSFWNPTKSPMNSQFPLFKTWFTHGSSHSFPIQMGVSENSVPHFPNGFADHYPYFQWLFHWEYTLFSDRPKSHLWGRRNGPPSGLSGGVRATRLRPRRLRRWHQVRGGAGGAGRTAYRPWPEGTETAAPGDVKKHGLFLVKKIDGWVKKHGISFHGWYIYIYI